MTNRKPVLVALALNLVILASTLLAHAEGPTYRPMTREHAAAAPLARRNAAPTPAPKAAVETRDGRKVVTYTHTLEQTTAAGRTVKVILY